MIIKKIKLKNLKIIRFLPFLILLSLPVILSGCYTKYTSPDGTSLLQYGEPEELKTLVEKSESGYFNYRCTT